VIDRTLRPLFDQSIRHAVQVIVTVLSVDDNDPTILAVNAASLALSVSNIPWNDPLAVCELVNTIAKSRNQSCAKSSLGEAQYKYDLTFAQRRKYKYD